MIHDGVSDETLRALALATFDVNPGKFEAEPCSCPTCSCRSRRGKCDRKLSCCPCACETSYILPNGLEDLQTAPGEQGLDDLVVRVMQKYAERRGTGGVRHDMELAVLPESSSRQL